jgi:phosphatidylglycerophosphate synthase
MLVGVVDRRLRALKRAALQPAAARLAPRLTRWGAAPVTALALLIGVAAAIAAAAGAYGVALTGWLANRVLDGLDGEVARRLGRADDRGGYVDLLADYVVYAALPIGAAVGATAPWSPLGPDPSPWTWPAVAALLAAYYVNLGSYTLLAALMEKRGQGARARGEATSLVMPAGLVEGFETIVLVALMLALPAHLPLWFALAAVLVAVTAAQRAAWGWRRLGSDRP